MKTFKRTIAAASLLIPLVIISATSFLVLPASALDCIDDGSGYLHLAGSADTTALYTHLLDAYPNPFNPQTTIAFDLPKQMAVSLRVFDVSGLLVKVLVNGEVCGQGRNVTAWSSRDDTGRRVASGTYFYRLEAGEYSETKRMALIK